MQLTINGKDEILREVSEIEHHTHTLERWIGDGGIEDSLTGYTIISGNGVFGAETIILTSLQTPLTLGKLFFDLHKFNPLSVSSATVYYIRVIYGTGTVAEAETAKQYTTICIISTGVGANIKGASIDYKMKRLPIGTKIWAKCKNATNLATVTGLFGMHEYDE
jgi:hypothetical protein